MKGRSGVVTFTHRAGPCDPFDLEEIPSRDRRAEIRCPRDHLVGVVTRKKILMTPSLRANFPQTQHRLEATCGDAVPLMGESGRLIRAS